MTYVSRMDAYISGNIEKQMLDRDVPIILVHKYPTRNPTPHPGRPLLGAQQTCGRL